MKDLRGQIDAVSKKLDPSARPVSGGEEIPGHWKGYLKQDHAMRLATAQAELAMIAPYFPGAVAGLNATTTDAFLACTDYHGLCRFLVQTNGGRDYFTYSRVPKLFTATSHADPWSLFAENAPRALVWVYNNVMDGLTDIYDFSGFRSSLAMASMAGEADTWMELPWYDALSASTNTRQIVELLSSGGGGYLLLDLNEDLSDVFEPQGLFIDVKAAISRLPQAVDLFPYLDEWMAIGLADADPR